MMGNPKISDNYFKEKVHKTGWTVQRYLENKTFLLPLTTFDFPCLSLLHRLMELPISVDRKAVLAENTYLLTLDGDIDFQPPAVSLLVDLMKKNSNLGAACGRIHPVGSGPMVW